MPIKTIKIMVEGGNVKPGPPLAPTLSQLGLNVGEVVKKLNEATSSFKGMSVPVTIEVDSSTKKYEIKVGIPTTTALLLKEAGASEPSGDPAHKKIGNLSLEQVIKIAIMKKPGLTTKSLKAALKSMLGTAKSIGLTVDNRDPKELVKEVEEGKYDDLLAKYENEWNGVKE
ncbi:50S ribosomal protein L11 [Saccharolobus solfataricus]|uniref:Large ribosomal subunit protein uL11 n=3 Tax=Saccharolobus solfataricus TaxID=2287 RepID=RL11_SACS2|nr:50S ribosomal protein L11 [Saccharolobus solfataricus]P96037.1 RecName: Full=Large ribosomal subunit protein uL11; AltName: Full=50S ribosomal protein L11 [Saccharolobus solfataricus P2]AAB99524.1 ribosomal protein L11 [Saccharolobus solfataricus]AKA75060.1 50S ribosomal protein L11 [Saccharolobus solfataricus]AKA77754.1 50S ribosomal protein L11 [Saccharolobus solfataricus]AKA80448.1 50S ribosomal protein L11 [Saccharolobus solfataricus]AZF69512.1 50S ribosomal protein L11 [Saccharolobus 